MTTSMEQLTHLNWNGAPFLLSYGITWLICTLLWRLLSERNAAYATLFQGAVALPIALGILFMIGAFRQRPDEPLLQSFAIMNATSQLLVLPLLIAMSAKKHYTLIPFVFSAVGAVHFLLYSWLYQTMGYIIMSIAIALWLAIAYLWKSDDITKASLACAGTGTILLLHAVIIAILRY